MFEMRPPQRTCPLLLWNESAMVMSAGMRAPTAASGMIHSSALSL